MILAPPQITGADWALEIVLIGLLAMTLFHALRLERALGILKRDKAELESLVSGFNASTLQAEEGVAKLRSAAEGAGKQLVRQIEAARLLHSDLEFIVGRAEQTADRLDQALRDARTRDVLPETGSGARLRSQAERDLLKALEAKNMISAYFRFLPATIVVLGSLLGLKSLELVRAATPSLDTVPTPPILQASSTAHSATPAAETSADYETLQQLRKRREELDARTRALDDRQVIIGAEEVKLQERLKELQALQSKLEQEAADRQKEQEAAWDNLVTLYEAMKPRDAATIFDDLDMPVLIELARRMNERKAAAILSAMQPDRARDLTAPLAQLASPSNKGI